MNKKLANVVKQAMKKQAREDWNIDYGEIAKDVAKNYTEITGIDVNSLFTKADFKLDNKTFTKIENVNAELFDKQLPKIYKWIKQNYNLGKDGYKDMIADTDFVDLITEELIHMVDIDKVRYEEE